MKYIIFLGVSLFVICLFGCKKQGKAYTIDYPIMISVANLQGQSLLDPETPGHFILEDIRKYDLVNGEAKLYYKSNLDWAYGYKVVNTTSAGYIITVAPNIESKESPTTTYIDWGNGDRDTIVCAMTKNDGTYQFKEGVWYNGEKVFTRGVSAEPIVIVKK